MTPDHMHSILDTDVKMLNAPTVISGLSGIHCSVIAGKHATGVGTPSAAAVADINSGFSGDMHSPNVKMFSSGTQSIIVAIGILLMKDRLTGVTSRDEVDNPKTHFNVAPEQTIEQGIYPYP
jgi:hypothetical protein